jgi:2-dehydro-3-deoxyphosphogluconate aldolase/(4S)-4-hydroxy-2-oxoglutarate aldolase
VLDLDAGRRCLDAGAQFLVSPCLVAGLAALAHAAGRPALIGAFTPGEVFAAHREGADIVKVFPASTGGPAYLGSLHAVFPQVRLCPTGGVSAANAADYFTAGAALVGVGNNIVDSGALARNDRAAVIAHAKRFLEI